MPPRAAAAAAPSSLSSLRPPPSSQSSTPASAPSTSRSKQCPACHKSFTPTGFGAHLNSKTCREALTSAHLETINYVRCPVPGCERISHATRNQSHIDSHKDDVPAPPSPAPSTVSSPPPSPHVGLEAKYDRDNDNQHVQTTDDPHPGVPEWLETWPHLFTHIPRIAHDVWTSICSVKLGEVFNLYRASDVEARDKVILDVLQLPRLYSDASPTNPKLTNIWP